MQHPLAALADKRRELPRHAGSHRPLGLDGWRLAFVTVAAISALTGLLNAAFTQDPCRPSGGGGSHWGGAHSGSSKPAGLRVLAREVLSMVRIHTFLIIVLQASRQGGEGWSV